MARPFSYKAVVSLSDIFPNESKFLTHSFGKVERTGTIPELVAGLRVAKLESTTMRTIFSRLAKDESGAVTVDWVVLTAALVGLGVAVISTVAGGATDTATGLGAVVGAMEPGK